VVVARIAGDAFAAGGSSHAFHDAPAVAAADCALSDEKYLDLYLRHLFLPLRRNGNEIVVAHAGVDKGDCRTIANICGAGVRLVPTRKQTLIDVLQHRFRARLARDATLALDEAQPALSARRVVTPAQRTVAVALAATVALGTVIAPATLGATAFVALALLYGAHIVLRILLYVLGWSGKSVHRADADALASIKDADLPCYSILVPLYREANMAAQIARALMRLDYPSDKIDIKLIFEENDAETIAAARALMLDDRFEILIVPDGNLHTKPRACNYALRFARGEFVVIFDAEDRPETGQLKKAVLAFRAEPDIACLQARLAFYNAEQNWLAKMFALEYGGWFAIMLPGLARLGVPLPLGGTSNHFRASVLRAVGGWDAYNVTEDADLGLRLARAGHRATPFDSTTFEEASASLGNWVRQRSRWLKGHLQTALVHARQPRAFARAVGPLRYAACLLFIGGAVVTSLVSPILWALALVWWLTDTGPQGAFYDAIVLGSIVLGNGVLTVLAMLVPLKTGGRHLMLWGLTACGYWLLISAGAYKGIAQLINGRASFWEKTDHGIQRCANTRARTRFTLSPRLAFAPSALALIALILSACAAFANPWLKAAGDGEFVSTLRLIRSVDGFTADPTSDGALDLRAEYGATDSVTLIMDAEVRAADSPSNARLEYGRGGARIALFRWDSGVVSFEGEAGTGAVRAVNGQPFFSSLHAMGEARVLVGQDFTLWGDHAWLSVEAGWRRRGGPPADEALADVTWGIAPRDDLFVMLQSFAIVSANDATDGYRAYTSDKMQLSLVYALGPRLSVQAGAIASVHGDDAGDAGGVAALWWRF